MYLGTSSICEHWCRNGDLPHDLTNVDSTYLMKEQHIYSSDVDSCTRSFGYRLANRQSMPILACAWVVCAVTNWRRSKTAGSDVLIRFQKHSIDSFHITAAVFAKASRVCLSLCSRVIAAQYLSLLYYDEIVHAHHTSFHPRAQ